MPLDMQPITIDKPNTEAKLDESKENMDENVFLAFARVFSGRLKHGQKIYVLGPRHDPALYVGKVSSTSCTEPCLKKQSRLQDGIRIVRARRLLLRS